MNKTLEFFFDFGSPASYLAWTQLPRIAEQAGAQIAWRPTMPCARLLERVALLSARCWCRIAILTGPP